MSAVTGTPDVGERASRAPVHPAVALVPVALGGMVVVAAWAVWRGAEPLVGYGMSEPPVDWMLGAVPALRLVVTVVGGVCLGLLAGLALRRETPGDGDRALSWAGVAAAVWAGTAFLASVVLVVAALGQGGPAALGRPTSLLTAMVTFGEPAAMLVAAVLAAAVTAVVGLAAAPRPGLGVVALAAVGVLAPAVEGPTTRTGAGHDVVTDAAVFAVLAGAVWFGGTVLALVDGAAVPVTERMQRRIAVTAGVATLVATTVNATVLARGEWWSGPFGRWALVQIVLLGVALLLVLRRARPGVVAAVLLAAMTAGAVATVEPPPLRLLPASMQQMMVGFDVAAPPTLGGLLLPGRIDLLWTVVGVGLAVGYLLVWRRVDAWPRARLVSWLAGCGLLVAVTGSTLGSLAMALFSAHMAVHMLLSTAVPVLLVLGGPLTLLARVRPAAAAAVTDAPVLRVPTHPLVALTGFAGSMSVLYLTPLFPAILPSHWAHQVLTAAILTSGYAFSWSVVGVDRVPRPLPHVARLAVLLASMPFHAFFAITLLGVTDVIGASYYGPLEVPGATDLLADQRLGAWIAWGAGEGMLLVVLVVVLARWGREDHGGRRPAGGDDAEPWDRMLADLAHRR